MNMNMSCPRCQSQQITKATAIVNAGTAWGSTDGTGVGWAGRGMAVVGYSGTTHMQSILARKLMPPLCPKKAVPASQTLTIICAILGGIVLLLCLCSFLFIPTTVRDPVTYLSVPNPYYSSQVAILVTTCGIIIGLCLLGLALSIIHTVRTGPRRDAEYQANVARWQRAMYNWDQLYYCHTCDSIYLLHTRGFAPVEQMYSLLF